MTFIGVKPTGSTRRAVTDLFVCFMWYVRYFNILCIWWCCLAVACLDIESLSFPSSCVSAVSNGLKCRMCYKLTQQHSTYMEKLLRGQIGSLKWSQIGHFMTQQNLLSFLSDRSCDKCKVAPSFSSLVFLTYLLPYTFVKKGVGELEWLPLCWYILLDMTYMCV